MKKKSLFLTSAAMLLTLGTLSACTGSKNSLVIWVGSESVAFYREKAKQFLKDNPDFGMKLTIVGADAGGAAGQMVSDNTACGDIVTIANDNIGKLSELSYITPIIDEETLNQINTDNPESFKKVIKNYLGDGKTDPNVYTFAVPYISQALFLYYDTRYVTDEQAQTFEGLEAAAAAYDAANSVTGTKSFVVSGTDGFNYSFPLLARNLQVEHPELGGYSKTRIYEGGKQKDCYNQTNDAVAVARYMQRNLARTNGGLLDLAGSDWSSYVEKHAALAFIGGAWHYNAFKDAVTSDKTVYMGCAPIPTFTLTAEDVAGIEDVNYPNDENLPEELRGSADPAPKAGDKYRGGSFVDCKSFVINMASLNGDPEKYYKSCKLLRYFSSREVQNESFKEALNVPAYVGSSEYIESVKDEVDTTAYLMARAQTGMSAFGIAQPFTNGKFNTYYYQNKAPDEYANMIKNTNDKYGTIEKIREALFTMEYIWKNGSAPNKSNKDYPTSFPANTTTKY